MSELYQNISTLSQDQYGNYVIQHILDKGKPKDKNFVINQAKGNILQMSLHKFASNVIEKCIMNASRKDRQAMIEEIVTPNSDGCGFLLLLLLLLFFLSSLPSLFGEFDPFA